MALLLVIFAYQMPPEKHRWHLEEMVKERTAELEKDIGEMKLAKD